MNKCIFFNSFKRFFLEVAMIFFGCFLMALATSLFLLPNKLSSGGFTGIATIIYYVFKIPMGVTIFLLNVPLIIVGLLKLGKGFIVKSILGTILLSVFIDILDKFEALTYDRFLGCIYGGIIIGIGMAFVLKAEASTGGSDLFTFIIKTYKKDFKLSSILIIVDTIIVFFNVIVFKNIEIGLYSAITIFIMGKMIDIVFEGIDFTKIIFIISDKYDKISLEISSRIGRGLTRTLC